MDSHRSILGKLLAVNHNKVKISFNEIWEDTSKMLDKLDGKEQLGVVILLINSFLEIYKEDTKEDRKFIKKIILDMLGDFCE